MRSAAMILAVCLAAPSLALAMTVDDLAPGKTVSGPNLTTADLHGKVVLVEYWGTR
jgi:hypothetical protein